MARCSEVPGVLRENTTSTRRRSMGFIALLWLALSAAVHAGEAEALHRLFQHWQSAGLASKSAIRRRGPLWFMGCMRSTPMENGSWECGVVGADVWEGGG